MASGYLSFCKDCTKTRVMAHREANLGRIQEYDRQRGRTEHRRAAIAAHQPIHRAMYPEKNAARAAVNNAVRDGRLIKPRECESCGAGDIRIDGHHDDYSLPMAVMWLCSICHGRRHHELNQPLVFAEAA